MSVWSENGQRFRNEYGDRDGLYSRKVPWDERKRNVYTSMGISESNLP